MKIIKYDARSPEENIALDEVMLAMAEEGRTGESLRFWESEEYFIVVGRSGRTQQECFLDRCAGEDVKIIRRISGGGTVLQGPGCMNWSAVVSYEREEGLGDLRSSYSMILGKLISTLKKKGIDASFFPVSDIAVEGRKVSGNAQARKRRYFLHHGTFLYGFDTEKVPLYLKHPSSEPEYRKGRVHCDFIANISSGERCLKEAVTEVFMPSGTTWSPGKEELESLNRLVVSKYSDTGWNHAF